MEKRTKIAKRRGWLEAVDADVQVDAMTSRD